MYILKHIVFNYIQLNKPYCSFVWFRLKIDFASVKFCYSVSVLGIGNISLKKKRKKKKRIAKNYPLVVKESCI